MRKVGKGLGMGTGAESYIRRGGGDGESGGEGEVAVRLLGGRKAMWEVVVGGGVALRRGGALPDFPVGGGNEDGV